MNGGDRSDDDRVVHSFPGSRRSGFDLSDLGLGDLDLEGRQRGLRLIVFALLALLLFVAAERGTSILVDWIWFRALGHEAVLLTVIGWQVGLLVAGAAAFAALAGGNLWVAFRLTDARSARAGVRRARAGARRALGWVAAGATATGAVLAGLVASAAWQTALRYLHAVPFEQPDPVFGRDVGFWVFELDALVMLRGWLLGAVVVTLAGTALAYFLLGRLHGFGTGGEGVHLGVLGSLTFVLIGWGHWLERFASLYAPGGAVFGVGYTEAHATIPAYTMMTIVALLVAALVLAAGWSGSLRVAAAAVIVWLVALVLSTGAYPALVQRFQVEPSELALEQPFLADHIRMTRSAYGLERVVSRSHPARGDITSETVTTNPGTLQNVRLWDEGPLRQSYNQIQFFRLYYDFLRVFTDRYEIGGQLRQVMLSTRELSPEKLPPEAQRWINRYLQFTHGYGVAMSPVTEVAPDGRPAFFLKDVPPTGELELTRPEIYYGLSSLEYVVAATGMQEFDYPGPDGPVYAHYEGRGGILAGSWLRRLLLAWHFGDINLLISEEITADSRVQFHRTVGERVARVAPFLQLDGTPYVVVAEGRLLWIQDAYTVSESYPYSQPWQGRINYIRNSVKAVVDAYDGSVDLYVAEPDDPVIRMWQAVFPGLFQPLEAMPESLRRHIRYPRDIFSIQVQMLLQYHMQDPVVFYNKEDQWSLPVQRSFEQNRVLDPYYIVARLPGMQTEEFLLIQPFTPDNRHNLVAWIAARNDAGAYGELELFRFPSGRHVDGPNQVEGRIDNDPVISEQFTLWGQVGSEVSRGNLLVIPLGDAILYAEPVFLQPEALEFPELRRIILADARQVVMHPTLDTAVSALVGERPAVATAEAAPAAPGAAPGAAESGGAPAITRAELDELARALEEAIRTLEQALQRLRRQSGGR